MTSGVMRSGSKWSGGELRDGWGDETADEQVEDLVSAVVTRFHQIADEHGSCAHWIPQTSEVIGDINEPGDPEELDTWRDQAIEEIWQKFVDEG